MLELIFELAGIAIAAGTFAAVTYKVLREKTPHKIQKFFADHREAFWYDGVWGCPVCMAGEAGLWGFVFLSPFLSLPFLALSGEWYIVLYHFMADWLLWLLCLAVSSTGAIFWGMGATRFISYLQATTNKYQ